MSTNPNATIIVDVRILDSFAGAKFIRELEDTSDISFVYAVQDPNDRTAQALADTNLERRGRSEKTPAISVITNTGKLNPQEFWEAVFDFVDNGRNNVSAVAGHYNHWQLLNEANKHRVPFKFVYNVDNQRMVYL